MKTHKCIVGGVSLVLYFNPCLSLAQDTIKAQDALISQMVKKYRPSTVFIKSTKETKSGEIVEEYGTAFIVSVKGHMITSCHVIDKKILDDAGVDTGKTVDKVGIQGAVGSREEPLEGIELVTCAQPPIDLALLKFKSTFRQRFPIPIAVYQSPSPGDAIASMGFPIDLEFFPRQGALGAEMPNDTFSVDMTLNPGDSGGPVFDRSVRVVAIAEGGYPAARIGIVRPVRHAAGLLMIAGVEVTATDANISSTPDPNAPEGTKVERADINHALSAFAKAGGFIPSDANSVKITYPFVNLFKTTSSATGKSVDTKSNLSLGEVKAKPGFKIVDAKFIVVDKQNAEVLNVSPQSNGGVARASMEKTSDSSATQPSFVRGFIETTQVRLDASASAMRK